MAEKLAKTQNNGPKLLAMGRASSTNLANFVAESSKVAPHTLMKYNKESHDKELKDLQKKIADLEAQLNYQTMRAEAYDTMIDIAEKKFNIPIRIESDTKQ